MQYHFLIFDLSKMIPEYLIIFNLVFRLNGDIYYYLFIDSISGIIFNIEYL